MPSMGITPETQAQVLIAGAGIAGIEAAFALRAFAGAAAHVRLIDPSHRFRIPATATGQAFGVGSESTTPSPTSRRAPGRRSCTAASRRSTRIATWSCCPAEAPDLRRPDRRGRGEGRAVRPRALTFRGHDDSDSVRGMVDEIARPPHGGGDPAGDRGPRGLHVAPRGYELALMAREHLTAAGAGDVVEVRSSRRRTALSACSARRRAPRSRNPGPRGHRGAHRRGGPRVAWGRLDIAGEKGSRRIG